MNILQLFKTTSTGKAVGNCAQDETHRKSRKEKKKL